MKEYKNENVDEEIIKSVEPTYNDFFSYCKENNLKYIKKNLKEYQMHFGQILYLESSEKGIVCWGPDTIDPILYYIPEEIDFDISSGIISSNEEFTIYPFN